MVESIFNTNELYPQWKSGIHTDDSLGSELSRHGLDSLQIIETLNLFRKKRNEERQTTGFILTGIGAFLGFISCLFTMLDIFPDLRGFMLYGLTSIAIVVIFFGLYYIFE